ncbi:hypothetical protein AB205_0159290 [Aquarana catesbeiana]|uniref:protein-tyrosine-phosphatase n=1 Tax=Aquarana catesbeiana TaxID=8400 RepID=A0A2G9S4U6_AQUCT|nr:hypothetical protein AB205_0159290 [Aquarana catesbeiana]
MHSEVSGGFSQEAEKSLESPLHEGLQWKIDSAATSTYEIGNPPDYRGQSCMRKHDVSMSHTARQVMYLHFICY